MARKPNYGFERRERERIKAEKKAARAEAKAGKKALRDEEAKAPGEVEPPDPSDDRQD